MLRDVIWKAFEVTGSMDAYILYKNLNHQQHSVPLYEVSKEISQQSEKSEIDKT